MAMVPDEEAPQPMGAAAAATSDSESFKKEKISSPPAPPYSKVFALGAPERTMLLIALILMIGSEAGGLYNPILLAQAYNALVDPSLTTSERQSDINRVMVIAIAIHFSAVLAGFFRLSIMTVAGERVVARLRNNLYSSLLKQEIAFFDDHKTGELVSRLSSDTTLVQQAVSQAVPEVMLGVVKLVTAIGLMFWLSPKLAGVTIGFTFLIFCVCAPFGQLLGNLARKYQDALGEAQTYSTEALGGMRTVLSFASEDRERKRYASKIGKPEEFPYWFPVSTSLSTTYAVGFWKGIATSGFFTIIFGVGFGSMFVSLWFGFKLVNDGAMTLGDLTAFQSYIFTIGGSLAQTARFVSQLVEARGASGRVFALLERTPLIPASTTPEDEESNLKPEALQGSVEFHSVDFSYPSRPDVPVLKSFSLSIPPNTTAALVGSSGAGKSTVVALMQRFYDVTGGSITIDGNDIRDLDLQWLRQHIGYVQQEPQLFGMTVRENICYGVDREVSQEEVENVCREANAHDFIIQWPNSYETLVGERGVKLSGGQKQRVAIARALLVNPRILLLDEATSALDAESEALVQDAIEKAMMGRTVLIVAHRLSTIQRAQQIVVLDNHQIADVGTHGALLDRCAKYQELIKRQSVIHRGPSVVPVLAEED
jgi:ATP-binding cassette subfamily B protein